jgi:hypothetical protein
MLRPSVSRSVMSSSYENRSLWRMLTAVRAMSYGAGLGLTDLMSKRSWAASGPIVPSGTAVYRSTISGG